MIQSDTLIEIKSNLHGKNSRVAEAQNHINDLEHKEAKTTMQNNKKNKEYKKSKDGISSLWDNCKHSNIHIIGLPEGKQREQEIGNLLGKTMKEKFLNLVKEIDMQVQEAQRIPNKMDAKRPTPRHIIIKMSKVKDKERILRAAREKKLVTYRGVPIRLSADFSKETFQVEEIGKK